MTKKRFVKLLMGSGQSKNAAMMQASQVGLYGSYEALLYFVQNPLQTVITVFQKVGVSCEEATEAFNKFAELCHECQ